MSAVRSYHGVSVALHWLIALVIFGLIAVGAFMTRLGNDQLTLKFELYQWHKSFGVTILLLTLLRLFWRITHRKPEALETGWKGKAARATHFLLYALSFSVPLAGWAMVSVSPWNIPTVLFDLVSWPHIPFLTDIEDKASMEASLKMVHSWLAYGTVTMVALHVFAALQHQFWFKHAVFERMWFSSKDTECGQ